MCSDQWGREKSSNQLSREVGQADQLDQAEPHCKDQGDRMISGEDQADQRHKREHETDPKDTTISSSKTHNDRQSPTRTGAVARYVEIPAINTIVPVVTTYQLGIKSGEDRDRAEQRCTDEGCREVRCFSC